MALFTKILMISVLLIYTLCLLFIFFYSMIQAHLVYLYVRFKNKIFAESLLEGKNKILKENPAQNLPFVTIQLPIYNELYVVERLMDQMAELDYPKDKFEIQMLDDSTDETVEIIANKTKDIKAKGIDIQHIRREDRKGFKAGALAYGLGIAKGEFIAIFDADFLPNIDFLQKTIPHFLEDEKIGLVQTRWEHLNENYSTLTKLQAFGLDAHFSVEQQGRNAGNHFMNFNGTAGVWRKTCITDAGGWQSDTLTEDLDLSYRAQLKNWKFKYLEAVGTPAELPVAMNALKTQQYRWTKGAAECTRKNLGKVLKAKGLEKATKFHATFHLMNSFIFICVIVSAVLSVPLLFIKSYNPELSILFNIASLFLLSFVSLSVFYWVSMSNREDRSLMGFLKFFPMFLSVSMGLSLHNGIAVLEGYLGRKTPFVRTPKFNITSSKKKEKWSNNKYLRSNLSIITVLEALLTIYFLGGIVTAFLLKDFGLLPFHIMLTIGFGYVCYYSVFHSSFSK